MKTTYHSSHLLKHRSVKKCCCFDIIKFSSIKFRLLVLWSSCEKYRITQRSCVENKSYSFNVHFVWKSWEARTSNILAFSRSFWNFTFIQQQQGKNAFTLFCLSHLFVHQNVLICSLLIRCIWVLEMPRDKQITSTI